MFDYSDDTENIVCVGECKVATFHSLVVVFAYSLPFQLYKIFLYSYSYPYAYCGAYD